MKTHILVVLMQDHPGVLNRAVSMFRRRGYNIASLAVGHTETTGVTTLADLSIIKTSSNRGDLAQQLE